MNKALCTWVLLTASTRLACADVVTDYVKHRFNAESVEVNSVRGLNDRIHDGKLHLHLHDFIELVLKNSTDVQLSRLDIYTSADQITAMKTPFDPEIDASFTTNRSISPFFFGGGSFFGGGGTGSGSGGSTGSSGQTGTGGTGTTITLPQTINLLSQTSQVTLTQLLPTGQTVSANFTGVRDSGDDYPFPTIFGSLTFTITQPLLQNRTNLQARAPLTIARTNLLISSEKTAAAIGDAVALAARQYWEAVLARDNIRVQQQNLELAQKSYDHDKMALDLGAIAKLDIYQSQTQVAERSRELVQAQFQYKAALDALRRLIGTDLTSTLRETEIVLEDDAAAIPPRSAVLPFEEALTKAMAIRPEEKAAQQSISNDALSARASRDALLPRLDLSLQGGASGPAFNQVGTGSVLGVPATGPYPGLGETLQQVFGFNYPSYGFSLALKFPIRNSTAQANLSDALVNRAKDEYQKRKTEQQIIFDVRQAIDAIELADASIETAVRARDLAQKNVEAEQQKYVLGTITAFEVLDSQTRLASSESALLNAYVTYQEAYVNYQRATWTLFDGYGMIVETPHVR